MNAFESSHAWLGIFAAQPLPVVCTVVAVVAAFLMGFARSSIGAGGFVVSPLMVLALGPTVGIAVVAVLMLPAAVTSFWQHRHDAGPKLSRPLIPAAVVGTALGGLVLWALVSDGKLALVHRRLELLVAALTLLYVFLVHYRERVASWVGDVGQPSARGLFTLGTAMGVSQTVANSGTPLMTVYFLCHRIGKEHFVGAQAAFLLVQNFLKLVPLVLLGVLHLGNARAAVLLLPLTFLGSWMGQKLFRNAGDDAFFKFYSVLLVVGLVASVLLLVGRDRVFGLL